MRKAWIVWGGWDGHEPQQVSQTFAGVLKEEGFEVSVFDTLDAFLDLEQLKELDLIVPIWTMGTITNEQCQPVIKAVGRYGVGIAGCHGGMCDSFRQSVEWQFMTGSQWVAHPGNDLTKHRINLRHGSSSPIVDGLSDFDVATEQYYIHTDASVQVLATTRFPTATDYHASNGEVDVPVAYTKRWGHGRVFYSSLGHHNDVFERFEALEMMRRGFLWAADGKKAAQGKDPLQYVNQP